jgi:hypothetical protein
MKLKHIGSTGKLEFNDLGKVVKGVSPQEQSIALDPTESIYLPDGQDVMYSAQFGDAKKYKSAGLVAVNETVTIADAATLVITHNFCFIPKVTIARDNQGDWEDISFLATDLVTVITDAAMLETTITNISGGDLTLHVRIS